MKYFYPASASENKTYSHIIKDYTKLTAKDKKRLLNNVKEFVRYVFWWLNLPSPTKDQLYIAVYIKNGVRDKEPSMLEAQRGLGKSLITEIVVMWLLRRNKDEKIVVVSATAGRSESFVNFCVALIDRIPMLNSLKPQGRDRASTKKLDVGGRTPDDSPSVAAFGVFSAKTGSRASILIYDDVEIPENSDTAQKREKILAGVRDTANLGISGVFTETCICTPQSSESVYNILKDEDGFRRTIIPAEYPEDISVYDGDLAKHIKRRIDRNPKVVGLNTDPRQTLAHLAKQKMKGKSRYKLHYMLDTTMSDAEKYPLKLSDLIVMDLDPMQAPTQIEYGSEKKLTLYDIKHKGFRGDYLYQPRYMNDHRAEYTGKVMHIDPSGRGTDETAYSVSGVLAGKIFLLDFGGIKGGYDNDALTQLAMIAIRFKVNEVVLESNMGDGSITELFKPVIRKLSEENGGHAIAVNEIRVNSQKEVRIIEALEPVMMQHRLVVSKQALIKDQDKPSSYSFTYQATHITLQRGSLKSGHDDIIDVVGMNVAYWVKVLAQNQEEQTKLYEDERIRKSLEKFMEKCGVTSAKNVLDRY